MLEYFNKYLKSDLDEFKVDNFKKCLKEIGWLDKYVADSSPKVDVLRINKELEGATSSEMIKSRFDHLLSNRGNSQLFRSAKNLVFAMRWLLYTASEKEQVRIWVRNNADTNYKSPPPLNMSVKAMCNFIGYVDSARLKCNCIYVFKLTSFIAGDKQEALNFDTY